jgi:hypothetical protein
MDGGHRSLLVGERINTVSLKQTYLRVSWYVALLMHVRGEETNRESRVLCLEITLEISDLTRSGLRPPWRMAG